MYLLVALSISALASHPVHAGIFKKVEDVGKPIPGQLSVSDPSGKKEIIEGDFVVQAQQARRPLRWLSGLGVKGLVYLGACVGLGWSIYSEFSSQGPVPQNMFKGLATFAAKQLRGILVGAGVGTVLAYSAVVPKFRVKFVERGGKRRTFSWNSIYDPKVNGSTGLFDLPIDQIVRLATALAQGKRPVLSGPKVFYNEFHFSKLLAKIEGGELKSVAVETVPPTHKHNFSVDRETFFPVKSLSWISYVDSRSSNYFLRSELGVDFYAVNVIYRFPDGSAIVSYQADDGQERVPLYHVPKYRLYLTSKPTEESLPGNDRPYRKVSDWKNFRSIGSCEHFF